MGTMSSSDIRRIDLPIDYSLLNGQQTKAIHGALRLAEDDFNAPCRNWEARIEELTTQLRSMRRFSPQRAGIEDEIADIEKQIDQAKKKGMYIDYSGLKRRIASGVQWEDIYPEAPLYYARTWDFYREFVGANSRNRRIDIGGWIGNISKLALMIYSISHLVEKFRQW